MTKTSRTYTIQDQKREIAEFLSLNDISLKDFVRVMDYLSHYTVDTDWAFVERACISMEEDWEILKD